MSLKELIEYNKIVFGVEPIVDKLRFKVASVQNIGHFSYVPVSEFASEYDYFNKYLYFSGPVDIKFEEGLTSSISGIGFFNNVFFLKDLLEEEGHKVGWKIPKMITTNMVVRSTPCQNTSGGLFYGECFVLSYPLTKVIW